MLPYTYFFELLFPTHPAYLPLLFDQLSHESSDLKEVVFNFILDSCLSPPQENSAPTPFRTLTTQVSTNPELALRFLHSIEKILQSPFSFNAEQLLCFLQRLSLFRVALNLVGEVLRRALPDEEKARMADTLHLMIRITESLHAVPYRDFLWANSNPYGENPILIAARCAPQALGKILAFLAEAPVTTQDLLLNQSPASSTTPLLAVAHYAPEALPMVLSKMECLSVDCRFSALMKENDMGKIALMIAFEHSDEQAITALLHMISHLPVRLQIELALDSMTRFNENLLLFAVKNSLRNPTLLQGLLGWMKKTLPASRYNARWCQKDHEGNDVLKSALIAKAPTPTLLFLLENIGRLSPAWKRTIFNSINNETLRASELAAIHFNPEALGLILMEGEKLSNDDASKRQRELRGIARELSPEKSFKLLKFFSENFKKIPADAVYFSLKTVAYLASPEGEPLLPALDKKIMDFLRLAANHQFRRQALLPWANQAAGQAAAGQVPEPEDPREPLA